ncbi:hypothetical protein GCM10027519_39490 [Kineococcus endophyticus]
MGHAYGRHMSENTSQNPTEDVPEENPGQEDPGSEEAAESPALDGYGNDTGFADEAADPE